jgi:hypothetical protein
MVRGTGLEPARVAPTAPQTVVSASSTTRALMSAEICNFTQDFIPSRSRFTCGGEGQFHHPRTKSI